MHAPARPPRAALVARRCAHTVILAAGTAVWALEIYNLNVRHLLGCTSAGFRLLCPETWLGRLTSALDWLGFTLVFGPLSISIPYFAVLLGAPLYALFCLGRLVYHRARRARATPPP